MFFERFPGILHMCQNHNSEMYGIGTVYLRLKGIVPPSTERANARRPNRR
jgi:hypothetical protein